MAKGTKKPEKDGPPAFPSKDQIIDFVRGSTAKVGKREIARAFQIKGNDRIRLKATLKELKEEGRLDMGQKAAFVDPSHLPPVMVIQVSDLDEDGELLARPAQWSSEAPLPTIYLTSEQPRLTQLTPGDRVLARLKKIGKTVYEAKTIRKLTSAPARVLGIYQPGEDGQGRLKPIDKKAKKDFLLGRDHAGGAEAGELVLAEVLPGQRGPRLGLRAARVVERLGAVDGLKSVSLIAIHEFDLPHEFPAEAFKQADKAGPADLENRSDLRQIPLVTIDGADARDFDDAVHAEPDDDPKNPGGWRLLVAIADVAHYVRPGDALDREALKRGNSTYFPDRVVPMLPQALSNGWCSLVPGEDRPCLAARLWLDKDGKLLRHKFIRGLMRSAARLTYEQVQEAQDGRADPKLPAIAEQVIPPLYGAYAALAAQRASRHTLELDLPERVVRLNKNATACTIEQRQRLDSHRLIEEFMITANIAAALELERKHQPCMYRVHDAPDPLKIEALGQVLDSFGLRLAKGQVIRPKQLNHVLGQVAGRPESAMICELVLRAQSQAQYSPQNIGHFGLALTHYAHFTSPIRRYADLLVHRALIRGLNLGAGALPEDAGGDFQRIGEAISACERRSAMAERQTIDRFTAAHLSQQLGKIFSGRISGLTRFGLFVTLDETGASGLIPMSRLPDDRYDHDRHGHSLVGQRWGWQFHLGDALQVRLRETEFHTGSIIFDVVLGDGQAGPRGTPKARRGAKRAAEQKSGRRRAGRRRIK